ncbi:MAG TPA: metal ABC transporter permease [Ktedonobacteraceae bacterium]|nr:metal ABC transporter permease [Ktedonobacteraceae bacterium]
MLLNLLSYQFMQNALVAGSIVAIVAAVTGYFVIVRGLTFAGHALAQIGFAGAAGAVLLGINPVFGLLVFTLGAGISIGVLGKEIRERDTAIGIIMMLGLGLGFLFLSLYQGYAELAYSILFGTILGISRTDVVVTIISGALTLAVLIAIFRPLLFSSYDPELAQARGVPVRALAIVFLALLAVVVSISVQIIGILLIFTLLIGPAATARRLAHSPFAIIGLAVLLALLYVWVGTFWAALSNFPISFCIATISFVIYLPVRLLLPSWRRRRSAIAVAGIMNTNIPHSSEQVAQEEPMEYKQELPRITTDMKGDGV